MVTSKKAVAKTSELNIQEKRIEQLITKANSGDANAMRELRPLIQESPATFELYGDMASIVQIAIMRKITGDGKALLIENRLHARLEKLKRELLGPAPSQLEKLLVERILTCWLEVQWADYRTHMAENLTLAQADFHQRRQERAQKRYLDAIKTLAQVRRLGLPAVQVNIAGQQVNTQAVIAGTMRQKLCDQESQPGKLTETG